MTGDFEPTAATEVDGPSSQHGQELREGLDYYLDHSLLVFTALFLRKRGYCCENGCRHCPYEDERS